MHVLERLFNMTHAQAIEIMLTVHRKGVAVVGVFSHEIAETKVAQVLEAWPDWCKLALVLQ